MSSKPPWKYAANADVVIVHTCEGLRGKTFPRESNLVSLIAVRREEFRDIKRYLLYYILQSLLTVTIFITFRVNLLYLNLLNTFRNGNV